MTPLATMLVLTIIARGWKLSLDPRGLIVESPHTERLFKIPNDWLVNPEKEGALRTAILILSAVHQLPRPDNPAHEGGGRAALN